MIQEPSWRWLGALLTACLWCTTADGMQQAEIKHANERHKGWTSWSPRQEIAPRFWVDPAGGRHGGACLVIEGNDNPAAFGSWQKRLDGIIGGRPYRFTAHYRLDEVTHARRHVSARLDWLDAKGNRVRPPDFALEKGKEGPWMKFEHVAPAPEGARSVAIALSFGWTARGSVRWDDIELLEERSPAQRVVRAVAIYHRPQGTKSAAESVEQFCRLAEKAVAQNPDIICLPEGITVIGTGKSYADVSEPIPGPTTEKLGALAAKIHSYIVAGIYERVGSTVYNTAILIGRKGEVAGKYRKTHLPYEEVERGLTPGDAYPTFNTEFGKVGLMICWDFQFPEPWRALALQGAEVVLLPIWGGNELLVRARAIENHIFLVTSSYDMKTFIVDPTGKVLAEATPEQPIAAAELFLDRKIIQPWLGDMKTRTWKERRSDIPIR